MKTMTFTHYTVKDISPTPWNETWNNLIKFAERMAPKLEPLGFKLKLRKLIMEDITEDNLMMANMVTVEAEEIGVNETPVENLLGLELDFSECKDCVTPEGQEFPCRTFRNFDGKECQVLPEMFFMEASLRLAFKSSHECGCHGGGCESCASGCEGEEAGRDKNSCGCGEDHHH